MSRPVYILLAVAVSVALAYALVNPLIIFLAKKQLEATFKESQVSFGECRLDPARQLKFSEISISRKQVYEFRIKSAEINYSLASLLRGNVSNIALKQGELSIHLPQESILEFMQYLQLGPSSALRINSLELSDINLDFNTKDLNVNSAFSCRLNLAAQAIDYVNVQAQSLGIAGVKLSNVSLTAAQDLPTGNLNVGQIKYDKLKINSIESKTSIKDKRFSITEFSAKALDGAVQGDLEVNLAQDVGYRADLRFLSLDIERFINDFNLKDKLEMSGRLNGSVVLEGKGTDITALGGSFSSDSPGGILVIKDKRLLENMAGKPSQSLDLLVESFKNYSYNKAAIGLSLQQGNLLLDVALDGDSGKRDLNITLHKPN